jgi:hypothetical protein
MRNVRNLKEIVKRVKPKMRRFQPAAEKSRGKAGFNGWGMGCSASKNGVLYGDFKSAGRMRWKNLGFYDVNPARKLAMRV